ncbi:MAG: porin [Isosphaeraceae bacterium]|nr:porin [Isosphaeraceae bacterium]
MTSETPTREQQLEARIQQLESMVNQLSGQVQQINTAAAAGSAPSAAAIAEGPARAGTADGGGLSTPGGMSSGAPALPSRSGGLNAPGQSLPPNPSVSSRFDSPATLENHPGKVNFGPGFQIRTDDEEFIFQFHDLTQFEYRGYEQGGQTTVKDGFLFPRQWFMFSGRISKPIGYFLSLAEGFDTTNILDVFVDFNMSPKFSIRAGRYKTPFTYEFLVEPIQGLIIPERSLFFNNFGQNRDLGVMAYGRLFDNKFDYAAGIFNGTRNGFVPINDSKSISAFMNYRPFADEEETLLENFNIGGSVFAAQGLGQNLPVPPTLRTTVATSGNSVVGIPFLTYNNNVRESGSRAFWDLHMAYFYQSLAIISEWQSGYQDYSISGSPQNRTHLPVESWYIQAGYLLTGETRSSVGIVKPLHPFDITGKTPGLGAWEVVGRYDYLGMGNQVFTNGLADRNDYTNSLYMTDIGFNWHMTQYVKFYFDWQHAVFGEPVLFAPDRRQKTSDMFMLRMQLYY